MASMRALRGLSLKRAATLLACKHVGPTRILRSITVRAAVSHDKEYQQTVTALMHLGLTASVLEQVRQERHAGLTLPFTEQNVKSQYLSIEWNRMYQYLKRMGLKAEDLNGMNAIHITGTKGKGSACAMIESILRAHGFKTGFYSSPHILEVRERIRINGLPLSKTQFVSHFWDCHNKFSSTKEQYEGTMPGFFQFLTVMAFRIFLQEKVDVAVIEAGIGGAYDPTNIMPKPLVSAITSIGCDHSDILGNTLAEIAWQKGGIYKPGYPAFTSPQLPEPLKMLSKRAKEQKVSSFHIAPKWSEYPGKQLELGISGDHQQINASLAVQVCKAWLQEVGEWHKMNGIASTVERTIEGVPVADPFNLPAEFREGLRLCRWFGRSQIVRHKSVTFFLDGAHTPESMKVCAEWFVKAASEETIKGSVVRILLFHLPKGRDSRALLQPLMTCGLHYAMFCPVIADSSQTISADPDEIIRSKANEKTWIQLRGEEQKFTYNVKATNQSNREGYVKLPRTAVFTCINHALHWITSGRDLPLPPLHNVAELPDYPLPMDITKATHVQLLITGNLYLVGGVMSAIGYKADNE